MYVLRRGVFRAAIRVGKTSFRNVGLTNLPRMNLARNDSFRFSDHKRTKENFKELDLCKENGKSWDCASKKLIQRPLRWRPPEKFSPEIYMVLSKAKLSGFVVLTAMVGYSMAPDALSAVNLFLLGTGTFFCALSANSFNQWIEVPYDSQMSRTTVRPLVMHKIQPYQAFFFAAAIGASGVFILSFVNAGVAILGLFNIFLYSVIYTSLKRISIVNTWIGSLVGAIPPIMGWYATGDFTSAGAYIIAGMLFAWQFPHFCSLSWRYREDYSKSGYMMVSVLNPKLNSRISLRYSLLIYPLIIASCYFQLTTCYFLIDGSIINTLLSIYAFKFWRNPCNKTADDLFFFTIIYLPILMILMMIHKYKGEDEEYFKYLKNYFNRSLEWSHEIKDK